MHPFTASSPWFSLSQRKKKLRQTPAQDTASRYRKRNDVVPNTQASSSLPLLFAADSIGHVKTKRGSLDEQSQRAPLPTPRQTPRQTPNKGTPQHSVVNGQSYGTLVGGRKRKPVLKVTTNTNESQWHPPQSPFDPRPPSSGCSSPSSEDLPLPDSPQHRCSPPTRLSPRSTRTHSGSSRSQSPPIPPRPQRRMFSADAGPTAYVPPPSTFSSLGQRPISAFPTSSRPPAAHLSRPVSLPADTSDIYNFFLGNNVTRKRVDFHEISPKDMRDLATDQKTNKRSLISPGFGYGADAKRKVKPAKARGTPAVPPKPAKTRHASGSPASVDKVWFATPAAASKCS